jgi:signal transduction histidine kinase
MKSTHPILIADDERSVLEAYRLVFAEFGEQRAGMQDLEAELFGDSTTQSVVTGFVPTLCRQGEEAAEAVRASLEKGIQFPVAFLDVRMPPGMSGIDAAERIRALDPDINIVIVTAYADSHPRDIAARVPPMDKLFYISKPIQAMELQQFALALTAKWNADRLLRSRYEELQRAQEQLTEARERAEHANQAKTEFLANMSHELRTPLNAVVGFTDVMKQELFGPLTNDRYREYLEDISQSSRHLLRVINELLDFSKIEVGQFEVQIDNFDLNQAIQSVVKLIRAQADHGGLTLSLDLAIPGCWLRGDEHRTRQVLLNLLSNSIKFTPRGGSIAVETSVLPDGSLCIAVRDTGIGMTQEHLIVAFEPFGQVESSLSRRHQGTGLGLPLAKRLTELQGGRLELETTLGAGTTARLVFPPAQHGQMRDSGVAIAS